MLGVLGSAGVAIWNIGSRPCLRSVGVSLVLREEGGIHYIHDGESIVLGISSHELNPFSKEQPACCPFYSLSLIDETSVVQACTSDLVRTFTWVCDGFFRLSS